MEEFGASRTVVREALTALSNRNLIVRKPRYRRVVRRVGYDTVLDASGPVVRQLLSDTEGVRNLYATRVVIERGLVRNAAENASKADIQALKAAVVANKEAIPNSDAFYDTDVAFHRVLYTIGGNPIFPAIHERFVSWLAPQWDKMERLPERNAHIYEVHAAIYQVILERDPDVAEAALISHLDVAWSFVKVDVRQERLMPEKFDYIVVVGGSSGCVAAARLATDGGARVLLLEAGYSNRHPLLDMPPGIFKMINGSRFMRYHRTTPQEHLDGRVHDIPQGHVLGGRFLCERPGLHARARLRL